MVPVHDCLCPHVPLRSCLYPYPSNTGPLCSSDDTLTYVAGNTHRHSRRHLCSLVVQLSNSCHPTPAFRCSTPKIALTQAASSAHRCPCGHLGRPVIPLSGPAALALTPFSSPCEHICFLRTPVVSPSPTSPDGPAALSAAQCSSSATPALLPVLFPSSMCPLCHPLKHTHLLRRQHQQAPPRPSPPPSGPAQRPSCSGSPSLPHRSCKVAQCRRRQKRCGQTTHAALGGAGRPVGRGRGGDIEFCDAGLCTERARAPDATRSTTHDALGGGRGQRGEKRHAAALQSDLVDCGCKSSPPTPILLLCPYYCYYTPTILSNALCGHRDDEIYECE